MRSPEGWRFTAGEFAEFLITYIDAIAYAWYNNNLAVIAHMITGAVEIFYDTNAADVWGAYPKHFFPIPLGACVPLVPERYHPRSCIEKRLQSNTERYYFRTTAAPNQQRKKTLIRTASVSSQQFGWSDASVGSVGIPNAWGIRTRSFP